MHTCAPDANMPNMTLVDIAKKLKLSHATVSRALNPEKQHLISARTRERVQTYANKMNFVPNRAARDLVTGRTRSIGVLLPTMFNSLFFNEQLAKTLAGIYHVLEQNTKYTCKLMILPHESTWDTLDQQALATGIDGLLISAQYDHFSKEAPYVPKGLLINWKKPVVFINLILKQVKNLNVVYFDNKEAARRGVTFLIQKGHRDIGLIYFEDNLEDSKDRKQGYMEALRMHRLPIRPQHMVIGRYTRDSGYQAALMILNQKGPKPTAIFCTNDEMAMGAIEAIKSLRLKCPHDIAVLGFDGLETGNYFDPRLTTVRQPSREIAEAGTRLLLDLVEERVKGPIAQVIPTDVLVRNSV